MDEKTLKRLLRAEPADCDQPGWRCPDEALLSAYVEHGTSYEKRGQIESHLADCEACLGQVAFLARQPADAAAPVAPGAVARARDLAAAAPSFWRPLVVRWGTAAAGVACVVLVVVVVLRPGATLQAPAAAPVPDAVSAVPEQPIAERAAPSVAVEPPAGPTAPPPPLDLARGEPERAKRAEGPPAVRNSATSIPALSVVSPAENATLARKDLELRWQAVPGSLYYEIQVVTETGDVVWQGRTEGTVVRPPESLALQADSKYFVRVRAHLAGGTTIRSAAVPFFMGRQ